MNFTNIYLCVCLYIMYTHTHIYKIKGIGVTKTSSSAFASGKEGVRSVLSLSTLPPSFSSIKWHQTARVGVGIYCHINEDALMNEQGWEWDTPLFFQILFTVNDNNFECYLYCKTFSVYTFSVGHLSSSLLF